MPCSAPWPRPAPPYREVTSLMAQREPLWVSLPQVKTEPGLAFDRRPESPVKDSHSLPYGYSAYPSSISRLGPGQESLLPSEDVEVFLNNLDPRGHPPGVTATATVALSVSGHQAGLNQLAGRDTMFQGQSAITAPPTYHHDAAGSFLHSASAATPVYVPTTRALPSAMGYMSNSGQGTAGGQAASASMWPMQDNSAYSTPSSHASRYSFPPTPSPPMTSPTPRDSGFGSPLGRPTGLSAYSPYMGPSDLSAWNGYGQGMSLGAQQGLRRPGLADYGESLNMFKFELEFEPPYAILARWSAALLRGPLGPNSSLKALEVSMLSGAMLCLCTLAGTEMSFWRNFHLNQSISGSVQQKSKFSLICAFS